MLQCEHALMGLENVVMWMSAGGPRSPLHFDNNDVLLTQIDGARLLVASMELRPHASASLPSLSLIWQAKRRSSSSIRWTRSRSTLITTASASASLPSGCAPSVRLLHSSFQHLPQRRLELLR